MGGQEASLGQARLALYAWSGDVQDPVRQRHPGRLSGDAAAQFSLSQDAPGVKGESGVEFEW